MSRRNNSSHCFNQLLLAAFVAIDLELNFGEMTSCFLPAFVRWMVLLQLDSHVVQFVQKLTVLLTEFAQFLAALGMSVRVAVAAAPCFFVAEFRCEPVAVALQSKPEFAEVGDAEFFNFLHPLSKFHQ